MSYDYGIKHISKYTGLLGVESKNIAKALDKKGMSFDVIDWETLGGDARDFGKRSDAVWSKLGSMYGIGKPRTQQGLRHEINKYDELQQKQPAYTDGIQFEMVMQRHMKRSRRAKLIDDKLKAKNVFSLTNTKGIQKWMKHPELYDVHGVDYHKGYSKRRRK